MTPFVLVIALMVLGLALVALEIAAVPGFGVPGILGGVIIVAAIIVAYVWVSPTYSAVSLAAGVVISGLMLWLVPKTRAAKSMVLQTAHTTRAPDEDLDRLVGRTGKVLTDLRPSGTAQIDDAPVDVVTEGQYVEAGTEIVVVTVEGVRVVVEPAVPAEDRPTAPV